MKEMLYYPYFEVRDENWLKFALLYFDCLRPVIPNTIYTERHYFSDKFLKIIDSTGFIKSYRMTSVESREASISACNEFENYLRTPERFGYYFNCPNSSRYIDKWKEPSLHTATLFDGKFTSELFSFCIKENLATPCNEGIRISQDLSFVYMCILADFISKKHSFEMITDEQRYSSFLISKDIADYKVHDTLLEVIDKELELLLPSNLSDIPLEKIVELRSRSDFNEARKEYVKVIDKIIAESKNGINITSEDLLSCEKEYKNFFKTIVTDIVPGAYGIAKLIVKIYISVKTGTTMDISTDDVLQLMPAAGIIKKGISNMANQVSSIESKKLARKYVAEIKEL